MKSILEFGSVFRRCALTILLVACCWIIAGGSEAAAHDLSGFWRGGWESYNTGHCGPLKASFCKICDDQYSVIFRGRFFKIIPFRYAVVLNVVGEEDGKVKLAGSNYIGRRFGTFDWEAEATETEFVARYTSCRYVGEFSLCRCSTCPTCCK